ncbi:MAG: hypothetical protein MJY45_02360 [Bacteroidales bacterium]|nr:hypothetical protein [Bacteroidales bacterium]
MKRYALIGYPVAGSLSPLMFRLAYGGRWSYDLVEEPSFDSAWKIFLERYDGVNVTAPYKETACGRADVLSGECRRIGATNLLVKRSDGICAYNSDYLGVRRLLGEVFGDAPRGKALIVGFGGAGKAALAAAEDAGFDPVVCNRSTDKANGIRPLSEVRNLARTSEIVIYTIPFLIGEITGIRCPVLLEANYRTPALLSEPGIGRYVHGREWMLRQAVEGYSLFTGEKPDAVSMASALEGR